MEKLEYKAVQALISGLLRKKRDQISHMITDQEKQSYYLEGYCDAIMAVKSMLSQKLKRETTEIEWIPVCQALPEEKGYVYASVTTEVGVEVVILKCDGKYFWDREENFIRYWYPDAWYPYDEPMPYVVPKSSEYVTSGKPYPQGKPMYYLRRYKT